jgi:hypothetical protein
MLGRSLGWQVGQDQDEDKDEDEDEDEDKHGKFRRHKSFNIGAR